MNAKVAVVIPIYKESLDVYEKISLHQCYTLMSERYDVVLLTPDSMDLTSLKAQYPNVIQQKYSADAFVSVATYNKMLLSRQFYQTFLQYEYVLIYQLDGYVFRDDLQSWCDAGYDYIGAPWLFEMSGCEWLNNLLRDVLLKAKIYHTKIFRYRKVGNGGVSLRRVQAFIDSFSEPQPRICRSKKFISGRFNEDVYWSLCVPKMKIPSADVAQNFSLDESPYGIDSPKSTFCHGWSKTSETRAYWKDYIRELSGNK